MDIEMPGVNGIEGVQIVKDKYPEMKILMQTIFEETEKIFQSICAGASGYILKNTPPSRMLEAIRETCEGGAPMSPSIATKVLKIVQIHHYLLKKIHSISVNVKRKFLPAW
jgi:DNA-binding NarL/FixJ family response regulator